MGRLMSESEPLLSFAAQQSGMRQAACLEHSPRTEPVWFPVDKNNRKRLLREATTIQ